MGPLYDIYYIIYNYFFRTNDLSADIERGSHDHSSRHEQNDAIEGGDKNPENVYNNNEDDFYTISYSVPVRRGRHLPSIPKPETEKKCVEVKVEVVRSGSIDERGSVTQTKIYETLDSLSSRGSTSPNMAAPKRPAWTLQAPDTVLGGASPLYLMMPEAERRQSQPHSDLSITQTSLARMSVGRDTRMSVTDTAKKVIKKISVSLSNKPDDGKSLCPREPQTESDLEYDDVLLLKVSPVTI